MEGGVSDFLKFAIVAAAAMSAVALLGCVIHDWLCGWLFLRDDDEDHDRVDG